MTTEQGTATASRVECACDLRTRLVGDGCEICNPAKALEYAKETIAELRASLTAAEKLLRNVHLAEDGESLYSTGDDAHWIKMRDELLGGK